MAQHMGITTGRCATLQAGVPCMLAPHDARQATRLVPLAPCTPPHPRPASIDSRTHLSPALLHELLQRLGDRSMLAGPRLHGGRGRALPILDRFKHLHPPGG